MGVDTQGFARSVFRSVFYLRKRNEETVDNQGLDILLEKMKRNETE
jgi:hypothetical protein